MTIRLDIFIENKEDITVLSKCLDNEGKKW